jgi:hypothetical protein
VVGECLGKLTLVDAATMLEALQTQLGAESAFGKCLRLRTIVSWFVPESVTGCARICHDSVIGCARFCHLLRSFFFFLGCA